MVGLRLFGTTLCRMMGAGEADEDCLFGGGVAALAISLTRVNRVFMIQTAAHRVSFNDLIAHGFVRLMQRISVAV